MAVMEDIVGYGGSWVSWTNPTRRSSGSTIKMKVVAVIDQACHLPLRLPPRATTGDNHSIYALTAKFTGMPELVGNDLNMIYTITLGIL